MTNELRRTFHRELDDVTTAIVVLGESVIQSIPRATAALLESDLGAAETLIRADVDLDARSTAIEEQCYRLLALQQPMAGDLRKITSALRINGEIERSGDLVVNICKGARRILGHPIDPVIRGVVSRMSDQAQAQFTRAIEAYATTDVPLASALSDMDDLLDRLQTELIQAIFESHRLGRIDLQVAVQLAVIARFYERIGDHAVNLGERTRYIVTGNLPEHAGAKLQPTTPSAADQSTRPVGQ